MSRDAPADKLVEQAFSLFEAFCQFEGDPERQSREMICLFEVLKEQYPHRFERKARAALDKLHGTT
jgi:hypothetical protein